MHRLRFYLLHFNGPQSHILSGDTFDGPCILYDLESYAVSIYLKYEPLRQSFPRIQGWPQNVTDLILLHIGSNFEDSLKYCFILRFLSYSATSASRPPPCKMGRMLQVMRGSSAAQCTMQWISFTFLGFLQHWAWSVKLGWGEESSLEWNPHNSSLIH